MKKIVWALTVVAAWVFFALPAFAGDDAPKVLPDPDAVNVHWSLPLIGVLIAAFRTAFSSDTVKFPWEWAGRWRAAAVAILAAAGTLVEQVIGGFELKAAALTFVMLGLPSIVQEVLKALLGAGKSSGGGTASASSGMLPPSFGDRPPPGYSTKLKPAAVGVAIGFCALLLFGCGAGKVVCPILDVASELCPLIAVRLPDGTTEMVPASAVRGMAMQARAARIAGASASDAGADQ
jgi:hypothetical protein